MTRPAKHLNLYQLDNDNIVWWNNLNDSCHSTYDTQQVNRKTKQYANVIVLKGSLKTSI